MNPEQSSFPGQPYPGQPQQPYNPQQQPYNPQPEPYNPQPGYGDQGYAQPGYQQPQPQPQQPAYPPADPGIVWGNPAPVSGPQVSPAYPGQPSPPASSSGQSRKLAPLVVANVVLLVVLLAAGAYVLVSLNGLNGDVDSLKSERTSRQAATADTEQKLKAEFDSADLRGKLKKVQDLTTSAKQALTTWHGSQGKVPVRTVQEAISKCNEAVLDYDATAARFPASMLGSLPARINTAESATSCSRLN